MIGPLPPRRTFAALAVGQVVVSVDAGIAPIAVPSISAEYPIGMSQVWWILMAYLIAAASSAMVMGALGDRLGRRPVYLVGQAVFVAGCLLTVSAPSINLIVLARVLQGIGAGAVTALALAMLTQSVDTGTIPRLEGWWMAVSAAAGALGPLIGGVIVSFLGWRWVFGLESGAMALAMALVASVVASGFGQSPTPGKVDVVGIALLTVALVSFVGGLSLLDDHSIAAPQVWTPVVVGLGVAGALVLQQRRATTPLADWSMTRRAPIPAALALLAVKVLVMTGALLQLMILVQNVLGFTPFLAGVVAFAMSATVVAFSPLSGGAIRMVGMRLTVSGGLMTIAAAFAGLSRIGAATPATLVIVLMAVMGVGVGLADPALNSAALEAVPKPSLGAFSGFLGLVLSMAGALGVAVIGAAAATVVRNDWLASGIDDASALIDRVVAGELSAAPTDDPIAGPAAAAAFAHGATTALGTAAVVIAALAVLVVPLLSPARSRAASEVRP